MHGYTVYELYIIKVYCIFTAYVYRLCIRLSQHRLRLYLAARPNSLSVSTSKLAEEHWYPPPPHLAGYVPLASQRPYPI